MSENSKVTAYLKGVLVYGTEPASTGSFTKEAGTIAPKMAVEGQAPLSVVVLNNPVKGNEVEYIVHGAAGARFQAALVDAQGRVISESLPIQAGTEERQHLSVNNSAAGMLFLRVTTAKEIKTVQVMRAK